MPSRAEKSEQFVLNEVEARAHQMLTKERSPINIGAVFGDKYKDSVIKEDLDYVSNLKREYAKSSPGEKELKKLAELFEMLFARLVELENWLGDDVFVTETSEYDDFRAGIDMIVELLKEGAFSHLGLAIDVTFSSKQVEKKLERIRNEIDYYELPQVKYFVSQGGDYKGELNNVPRVVVAINRKQLMELTSLWLDIDFLRKRISQASPGKGLLDLKSRLAATQEKLANHPFQIEILAQIELELETFVKYAARKQKTKISEKFKNMLAIIKAIRGGKKKIEDTVETKTWSMSSFHQIDSTLDWLFT